MSRLVRNRMAAVLLGGLLLGAPLLTNGTASAEQTGHTPTPIPTCDPDQQAAPIRAADRQSALMQAAGRARASDRQAALIQAAGRAQAADRQSAPMQAAGQAQAADRQAAPILAGGRAQDADLRVGTTSADEAIPIEPLGPAAGADSGSRPGLAPKPDPSTPPRAHTKATKPNTTKVKTNHIRGTGSSAPASLGKPPGDGKNKAHGVPTLDFPPPPDPAPAAATVPPRKIAHLAAAGPATAVEPAQEDGPIGLLGVVAIVCVLGAGVSLIRAIAAQRANRTNIA